MKAIFTSSSVFNGFPGYRERSGQIVDALPLPVESYNRGGIMSNNTTIQTSRTEIQEQINGPYRQLDISLAECWEIDCEADLDLALIRENATDAERELLDLLCKLRGAIDSASSIAANVDCTAWILDTRLSDYITTNVQARVLAQGRYIRDGKWTRSIAN